MTSLGEWVLYSKLKRDYDAAIKSQASAKKQLEDETIMRDDLVNRIQSEGRLRQPVNFSCIYFRAKMYCHQTWLSSYAYVYT